MIIIDLKFYFLLFQSYNLQPIFYCMWNEYQSKNFQIINF